MHRLPHFFLAHGFSSICWFTLYPADFTFAKQLLEPAEPGTSVHDSPEKQILTCFRV